MNVATIREVLIQRMNLQQNLSIMNVNRLYKTGAQALVNLVNTSRNTDNKLEKCGRIDLDRTKRTSTIEELFCTGERDPKNFKLLFDIPLLSKIFYRLHENNLQLWTI